MYVAYFEGFLFIIASTLQQFTAVVYTFSKRFSITCKQQAKSPLVLLQSPVWHVQSPSKSILGMQEGDSRDAWPAEPRFLLLMRGHSSTEQHSPLRGASTAQRGSVTSGVFLYFCNSSALVEGIPWLTTANPGTPQGTGATLKLYLAASGTALLYLYGLHSQTYPAVTQRALPWYRHAAGAVCWEGPKMSGK